MRKYILVVLFAIGGVVFAQEKSISERLNLVQKKTDKFNVFLNFQSSFDAVKVENEDLQTVFKARQLRLEFKGKISDKLSYRLLHRLNKSNASKSLDNLAAATDLMYITYQVTDKFGVTFGKQFQAWGGFEYDLNPMNVYEYSDFCENMDIAMLGINFGFQLVPKHVLNVQITNTRNSVFSDVFDVSKIKDGTGIVASNNPLTYILNWNGNLLDGVLQTHWAYGIETQAKDKYSKMLTLGTKLNLEKFQVAFDYMRADQDIDRLRYVSRKDMIYQNTIYNSFITKLEFQPAEQWNLFAKYMYEIGAIKDVEKNRISQGYFVGVEHLPFKEEDCRFFLTYVGRGFDMFGVKAPSTNRISVGVMYKMKAF